MLKHILLSILLSLPCAAAFAASETPEAFLERYYAAVQKAKSLQDLDPYCTPIPEKIKARDAELMKDAMFSQFAVQMMKSEPTKFKVLSKRQEGDRVYMELAPNPVPAEFAAQSKNPGFSMKGEAILVSDGKGGWKVHKDYWVVQSKDKNGSSKTSFGRNPDNGEKKNDGEADATQSSPRSP